MVNKRRLIDANEYPCQSCNVSYCYKNCAKFIEWFNGAVDAVEVVHGRWEWIEDDTNECSACGHTTFFYPLLETVPNYCPNCGAKMDGDMNA